MSVKPLAIDLIKCDGGTQMRAELSVDVYMDYRDKILAGVEFPPLDVFYDGSEYWLADGFHRFYGHREAKRASVKCTVHNGTVRDAILFAVGANASHGLPRRNADKHNCVTTLLNDPEWVKWSDRKIADQAAVSNVLVSSIRKELLEINSSPAAKTKDEPKIGKDGKARKAKTKPQPSVTGTAEPTPASPPSLPSVGTVNRTEQGSQGDGGAGECPRGGPHERGEDGTCEKCKDPPDTRMGQTEFDTSKLDKQLAADKAKPDLEVLQAPYDAMLNAITQIKKLWNEVTADERNGVYCVTKKQRVMTLLDELRPPIAQARPMKVCTFCKGKGCEKCSGCGWWPRSVVEGLSR